MTHEVPWSTGAWKSGWWDIRAPSDPCCRIIDESPGLAAGEDEESVALSASREISGGG